MVERKFIPNLWNKARQNWPSKQLIIVHFLVICFGLSAWVGVNGIFVQLPLLVLSSPERWKLPAYLVVIIQAANVGPIVYVLTNKWCPRLSQRVWIWALLLEGFLAMCLLAFLYDKTLFIGDNRYSLAMYVLTFFTALVGCTSSVLFMPYLRFFKDIYLVSYFIGEGLSGLVPSIVALLQGVGGNPECKITANGTMVPYVSPPRFPPKYYFLFLSAILGLSVIAFTLLRYLPIVQGELILSEEKFEPAMEQPDGSSTTQRRVKNTGGQRASFGPLSKIYLYVLVALVCFLGNGFLHGIQSYSCLPYGNVAYHLTVTLSHMANPAACFLAIWILPMNLRTIGVLSVIILLLSNYVTFLAIMSPNPPLHSAEIGVFLLVLAWILLMGIISYVKLAITTAFRCESGDVVLSNVGIIMQVGSACGALLSFLLTNYTTLFTSYIPCT
ncbi:solute carrier family 52, riboflavin transporter, member 3-B isoform X2 [Orussus abietinus]|nr:solute carrier family 52, riboflavin transporter, member 3-B isoform X2 [Orussus abietinus]XP_012276136.1 solute carrier family 52, riboflavin transporter, member 3-B isoform X2 [Orussus abietinus]